jgi:hypothetical protein
MLFRMRITIQDGSVSLWYYKRSKRKKKFLGMKNMGVSEGYLRFFRNLV